MSRFSPTVSPTWGASFGHALEGGVDAFIQARRQRNLDDMRDNDRTRAESIQNAQLAQQGIHLQKPGELPPHIDVDVSGGPNGEEILNQSLMGALHGPQGAQALTDGPQPTFRGRPGGQTPPQTVDPRLIAQALANHVASGQPLRRPEGQPSGTNVSVPGAVAAPQRGDAPASAAPAPEALSVALSRNLDFGPGYYVDRDEQQRHRAETNADAFNRQIIQALGKGSAQDMLDPGARRRRAEYEDARTDHLEQMPAGRGTQPRVIRTAEGMFTMDAAGNVSRLENDGQPLHVPLGIGRGASNAEPPAHRETRQGLTAVRSQLNDTEALGRSMDRNAPPLVRFPGIASGTAADSADARDFSSRRGAVTARADSLRGVSDRLAARMTGNAGGAAPAAAASSTPAPDDGGMQAEYNAEGEAYQRAIAGIRRNYGSNPAEMERRLRAANDRYNERVGKVAKSHTQGRGAR